MDQALSAFIWGNWSYQVRNQREGRRPYFPTYDIIQM